MKKKLIIGIIMVMLIGVFLVRGGITGDAVKSDEVIKIPLFEISETAKWYDYGYNGKTITYFVVKGGDGSVKTAFDACDVCYGAKKGYSQDGDVMVCNNCGNRYAIDSLGTENLRGGGCWPGYLPNKIEGNYVIIKESDIKQGVYRF